jgi:anti-sigma factor RsiW
MMSKEAEIKLEEVAVAQCTVAKLQVLGGREEPRSVSPYAWTVSRQRYELGTKGSVIA